MTNKSDLELDCDVLHEGSYYYCTAFLQSHGTYTSDDTYYWIGEDPVFYDLTIYSPEDGDPMDNPDDALCELALHILSEIYWSNFLD